MQTFRYALNFGGYLFLGTSEGVGRPQYVTLARSIISSSGPTSPCRSSAARTSRHPTIPTLRFVCAAGRPDRAKRAARARKALARSCDHRSAPPYCAFFRGRGRPLSRAFRGRRKSRASQQPAKVAPPDRAYGAAKRFFDADRRQSYTGCHFLGDHTNLENQRDARSFRCRHRRSHRRCRTCTQPSDGRRARCSVVRGTRRHGVGAV